MDRKDMALILGLKVVNPGFKRRVIKEPMFNDRFSFTLNKLAIRK